VPRRGLKAKRDVFDGLRQDGNASLRFHVLRSSVASPPPEPVRKA
jgi:hypothetical protein